MKGYRTFVIVVDAWGMVIGIILYGYEIEKDLKEKDFPMLPRCVQIKGRLERSLAENQLENLLESIRRFLYGEHV